MEQSDKGELEIPSQAVDHTRDGSGWNPVARLLKPSSLERHNPGYQQRAEATQDDIPVPLDRGYLNQPRPGLGGRRASSISIAQIGEIVSNEEFDTDTYNVSELRDGFFDALFLKSVPISPADLQPEGDEMQPPEASKGLPSWAKSFYHSQYNLLRAVIRDVTHTRTGVRLIKSFLGVYIAYILCLIPTVQDWLGRYHYIMVVSVLVNHPARTVGSQLDGAFLTTLGTGAGIGWGIVALLLSTSTLSASAGYGGILALFLALFMTIIGWMRAFFTRFYQGVLCAGIAITFTTLAETNSQRIRWQKLLSFAVAWFLGQAIALLVNFIVFPDTGARRLAATLHESFDNMQVRQIH